MTTTSQLPPHRRSLLDRPYLVGLGSPVALGDLELDALCLVQAAVARGLDGREVYEDIGAAAVDGDETIALFGVEPLHGALLGHVFLLAAKQGSAPRAPSTVRAGSPRP